MGYGVAPPVGWRSMRITSAPMSASIMAANGHGPSPTISTTRIPLSGPLIATSHAINNPGPATHELLETSYWFSLAERVGETSVSLKRLNSRCSSIPETLHQRTQASPHYV